MGNADAKAIQPAFDLDHSWARFCCLQSCLFCVPCCCSETQKPPEEGWSGIFYSNPNDPALFVPKRYGIGYTLNFGNPWSWIVLALIFATVAVPTYFIRNFRASLAEISCSAAPAFRRDRQDARLKAGAINQADLQTFQRAACSNSAAAELISALSLSRTAATRTISESASAQYFSSMASRMPGSVLTP